MNDTLHVLQQQNSNLDTVLDQKIMMRNLIVFHVFIDFGLKRGTRDYIVINKQGLYWKCRNDSSNENTNGI